MTDPIRIFAVASDEALVDLINSARMRLVVIAPALTKSGCRCALSPVGRSRTAQRDRDSRC